MMQTLEAKPFATFSDTKMMRDVFQRLPEFADTPIRSCALESVKQRVKPDAPHKSSLLACYCLELEGGKSEQLYLKAFAGNTKDLETTPGFIADLNALVWHFPDDPRLPQLAQLVDTEKVK